MPDKVNLMEAFGLFEEAWSSRVAGVMNDVQIRLAKFRGEFLWHLHEVEDQFFLVNRGELLMRFRYRDVPLSAGEFIIVPRGVEHMPVAQSAECEILTVSPRNLRNTGNVDNERTVHQLKTLDDEVDEI